MCFWEVSFEGETMGDEKLGRGLGGKQRMRWTPELHKCFEKAVNQLGGPDSKYKNLFFFPVFVA